MRSVHHTVSNRQSAYCWQGRDSIYLHEYSRGDTVFRDYYCFSRDRYGIFHADTVRVSDTVYVSRNPSQTVLSRDAPVPRFYQNCTIAFFVLLAIIAIAIAIRLRLLV